MAADDKKTPTEPASKKEGPAKTKSPPAADASAAVGGEKAAAPPAGYSRGEGQKPVSQAYKDNWNTIFAKKKKR
jgi:hypothetical protein